MTSQKNVKSYRTVISSKCYLIDLFIIITALLVKIKIDDKDALENICDLSIFLPFSQL